MVRHDEPDDTIPPTDEISLFELGTSLLRNRRRIVAWMVIGAVLTVAVSLFGKPSYTATSSFAPQSSDDGARSGLASLAGQFGIRVGGGEGQANSPDFYSDLLKSRVILAPIVADTFTVVEEHRKPDTLLNILEVKQAPPARRLDLGITKLQRLEATDIKVKTGVIKVSIQTPWPSLSLEIAQRLVAAVNQFNLRTRQSQASEERRFTETRLQEARTALRASEDRLQVFLQHNRQGSSPELKFEEDRLQRDVGLNQQVVTSLAQSYEEVRIREVRNTPVITVIEPPILPTAADPRGRAMRAFLGLVVGGLLAVLVGFFQDLSRRRRTAGNAEAEAFHRALEDARNDAARIVPGMKKRTD